MFVLTLAFLAGIAVALPPSGPLTLLFYRHAMLRRFRSAAALAGIAAVSDGIYAAVSTYGYGWLLDAPPTVVLSVRVLGVMLIAGLGVRYAFFPPPVDRHLGEIPPSETVAPVIAQGMGIAFFNPSALVTWVVAVDVLRTTFGLAGELSPPEKLGLPVAVAAGTATWFLAVLTAWRNWIRPPSPRLARVVVRLVGLVLLGTALVYGWRAARQDAPGRLRAPDYGLRLRGCDPRETASRAISGRPGMRDTRLHAVRCSSIFLCDKPAARSPQPAARSPRGPDPGQLLPTSIPGAVHTSTGSTSCCCPSCSPCPPWPVLPESRCSRS